jgi:hypothetical protein
LAYEAVSTSIENVESGARELSRNGFSVISAYLSPPIFCSSANNASFANDVFAVIIAFEDTGCVCAISVFLRLAFEFETELLELQAEKMMGKMNKPINV